MPILHGRAGHSAAYQRYRICKEFGWDYYTYENQPAKFIDEIMVILYQEAQRSKQEHKKVKTPSLSTSRPVRRPSRGTRRR